MVSVIGSGMKEYAARDVYRAGHKPNGATAAEVCADEELSQLEQVILRALAPFPDARAAVVQAVDRLTPAAEDST